MSRVIRVLGRVGFGAMVIGALAFGATQALAASRTTDDCQPCSSQSECFNCCRDVLGFEGGDCWVPNCLCY